MTPTARRWLIRLAPAPALLVWAMMVARTGRWPGGDGPHVIGTAQRLALHLRAGELAEAAQGLGTLVGPHPPGAYLPATLVALTAGPALAALVVGGLVLLALADAVRRLGGGPVAALVVAASPLVWLQAEASGPDLIAAACVAQALSWLVASDRLSNPRAAAAWGAWMGAAFLTKYTAPLFLWGPCLLAGWWVVRAGRWRALGLGVAAFGLVAAPWYATHIGPVVGYLGASQGGEGAVLTNLDRVEGPWWGLDRAGWYPLTLIDGYGWPGVAALMLGIAAGPRRRAARAGAWAIPALAVAGGLLVLTTQSQRQDRYLLPAIPLVAAMVGASRARWLAAPVLAVGAYGVAATFATATDVPASRDYTHVWSDAGHAWPWVDPAFRPVSLDPTPWRLDHGIARLRHWHGRDTGTVAFLLDERDGAPTFGVVLSRVTASGLRWDVATAMVMDRRGAPEAAVFVGPFAAEGWPSRDFTAMLAFVDPSHHRRQQWLDHTGMTLRESWDLPHGREGRIYTWDGDGRVPGTPPPLPPLPRQDDVTD